MKVPILKYLAKFDEDSPETAPHGIILVAKNRLRDIVYRPRVMSLLVIFEYPKYMNII